MMVPSISTLSSLPSGNRFFTVRSGKVISLRPSGKCFSGTSEQKLCCNHRVCDFHTENIFNSFHTFLSFKLQNIFAKFCLFFFYSLYPDCFRYPSGETSSRNLTSPLLRHYLSCCPNWTKPDVFSPVWLLGKCRTSSPSG